MSALRTIPCADCARTYATPDALAQHRQGTHLNPNWLTARAKPGLTCPKCGNKPATAPGKFGTKATCCGLWSWNGKPLVDRDTHAARIIAHAAFDPIWKSGAVSRGEAYRRLRVVMGMSAEDCHIGLMTEAQARRVATAIRAGEMFSQAVAA